MERSPRSALTSPLAALRRDLDLIVRAALRAVHAGTLLRRRLDRDAIASDPDRTFVVAAGKAAWAMLDAFAPAGARACARALVSTSSASIPDRSWPMPIDVHAAGHPVPNEASVAAASAALAVTEGLGPADALVLLLSGGASAQLAVPSAGLTLHDKVATTRALLAADASIAELNAVRKHLSAIKGGHLAAAAAPATVITFALSDVVGDDAGVIGSGPTVGDPTTFGDALDVLERSGVVGRVPARVVEHLWNGAAARVPETPKPGDPRLSRSAWHLVGSRRDAMRGAAARAAELGYGVTVVDEPVIGPAREAGPAVIARAFAAAAPSSRPACVVSSGETVVRVRGDGRGGRNQELALAAVVPLERAGADAVLASLGTDGRDGPTDAAGARADGTTGARARALGLSPPARWLEANDSHRFFAGLGDLIVTGPTDTNVADLQVVLIA